MNLCPPNFLLARFSFLIRLSARKSREAVAILGSAIGWIGTGEILSGENECGVSARRCWQANFMMLWTQNSSRREIALATVPGAKCFARRRSGTTKICLHTAFWKRRTDRLDAAAVLL